MFGFRRKPRGVFLYRPKSVTVEPTGSPLTPWLVRWKSAEGFDRDERVESLDAAMKLANALYEGREYVPPREPA
jgi:hypothetical protein